MGKELESAKNENGFMKNELEAQRKEIAELRRTREDIIKGLSDLLNKATH